MEFAVKISEVPSWGKKVVSVAGQEVLIVNIKGQFYACETECPHQGAPLSGALVKEADHLTCARHGWHFNLITGACRENAQFTLKVYPVTVEGGDILVEVG
jgi:nitrite reductase/ring-hydroxylating ferredoxin subunit